MITNKTPYKNPHEYLFLDQKRKLDVIKRIRKQIDKFTLTADEIGMKMHSVSIR